MGLCLLALREDEEARRGQGILCVGREDEGLACLQGEGGRREWEWEGERGATAEERRQGRRGCRERRRAF